VNDEWWSSLVRIAVYNTAVKAPRTQNMWVIVRDLFGVGSTTACLICRQLGIEPYSEAQDNDASASALRGEQDRDNPGDGEPD
jgi:ribosomal protein S13